MWLTAALVGLAAAHEALGRPSSRGRAEELFGTPPRAVLAYEVWDGVPHILFRLDASSPISFNLVLDRISIEWPPAPAWQFSGAWYSAEPTDAPANLHLARCTGI